MSEQVTEKVRVREVFSRTDKTYTVILDGCEPREWPYSKQRTYRPVRLVVVKRDGNVASVDLTGPMVKKDGGDGAQWATERFYGLKERPAWLRSIIGGLT